VEKLVLYILYNGTVLPRIPKDLNDARAIARLAALLNVVPVNLSIVDWLEIHLHLFSGLGLKAWNAVLGWSSCQQHQLLGRHQISIFLRCNSRRVSTL